jgi:hypothetical protein
MSFTRKQLMSSTIPPGETPFVHCPMCGGVLDEQPRAVDRDLAHIIGECLCADELMIIFARGIDRRADSACGDVLEMLAEYAALAERLAKSARQRGAAATAEQLQRRARAAHHRALRLRGQYFI